MIALFEKFSSTGEGRKSKVFPLKTKINPYLAFDKLLKYFNDTGYVSIESNKDFLDIYCKDRRFEISIQIGQENNGGACINMSVFMQHQRGLTRRRLIELRSELETLFKDYLV